MTDKWEKINEKAMGKARNKLDRVHSILCDSLADIQNVPCLNADDVQIISALTDQLKIARAHLENSFKAKIKPEDWNE